MSNILDSIEIQSQVFQFADSKVRKRHLELEKQLMRIKSSLNILGNKKVIGVQVDFKNKRFTRLANAVGLNAGEDFNQFSMYGNRKRCNVMDNGAISAWYGDSNYREDGSNGQVMVYQPKFYYAVLPIKYEKGTLGYKLRCCDYYICEEKLPGFKLHPAFRDKNGNEVDYIFESAYEGSLFDVSSDHYLLEDEQLMDTTYDKLCSIVNAKPASGSEQGLTRLNLEKLANNRGENWHNITIQTESMCQLLMLVEYASMNMQSCIGKGIVDIPNNSSYNCSSLTGSTSNLGNETGVASSTINSINGNKTTYTSDGKVSISYRGKENPWGNIYKHINGINIYGNSKLGGGVPYICTDYNFSESKIDENYKSTGIVLSNSIGYISSMGWSEECDWLFLPTETDGDSALPVGDYTVVIPNMNGYKCLINGGYWSDSEQSGAYHSHFGINIDFVDKSIGGRLVYIPEYENPLLSL